MNVQPKLEAVRDAEDVQNLLDHVGWTDVVLPKLLTLKAHYEGQLVSAVLGARPVTVGNQLLTSEQLAGMVYGIDYIIATFKNVLQRGDRALDQLQSAGFVGPTSN